MSLSTSLGNGVKHAFIYVCSSQKSLHEHFCKLFYEHVILDEKRRCRIDNNQTWKITILTFIRNQ